MKEPELVVEARESSPEEALSRGAETMEDETG